MAHLHDRMLCRGLELNEAKGLVVWLLEFHHWAWVLCILGNLERFVQKDQDDRDGHMAADGFMSFRLVLLLLYLSLSLSLSFFFFFFYLILSL